MKRLFIGLLSTAAIANVAFANSHSNTIVSASYAASVQKVNHKKVYPDAQVALDSVSIKVYGKHHKYLYSVNKRYMHIALSPYFLAGTQFTSNQLKGLLKPGHKEVAGYQVLYSYDVIEGGKNDTVSHRVAICSVDGSEG